jgi:hypothetical protein
VSALTRIPINRIIPLPSPTQPYPVHPHQHLLLFVFFMMAIPTEVRRNLSDVLICISFMAKDARYFFMCLLAICSSLFEKYSFAHVLYLFFWCFNFFSSLYMLGINPMSDE